MRAGSCVGAAYGQAIARLLLLLCLMLPACTGDGAAAGGTTSPQAKSPAGPAGTAPLQPASTPSPTVPQREEAALPDPRQETAAAGLDGRLYVIGGFDAVQRSTATVFVHETGWSAGPPLPLALDHPAAATLDGHVYVAGGFSAGAASRRVFRLDGDGWSEVAPLGHARGALATVATAGLLIVLGGNDGALQVAPVEAYDPAGGAWREAGTLPVPRNHLSGFSLGGLACAAGGRPPTTPRVDCLDPRTGTWSRLPDLPQPTSGAGAGSLGALSVVAGGEDAAETSMNPTLLRWDGVSWLAEAMLRPRHGIQLAPHQGRLWACGGADLPGLHAVGGCTSVA